jgi:hypothetical protein
MIRWYSSASHFWTPLSSPINVMQVLGCVAKLVPTYQFVIELARSGSIGVTACIVGDKGR